jgi:hypothetical protein
MEGDDDLYITGEDVNGVLEKTEKEVKARPGNPRGT